MRPELVPPPESAAFAGTLACGASGTDALDCAPALGAPGPAEPTAPAVAGAAEAAPWVLAAACADCVAPAEAVPDHRGDASGTLSVDQAMACLPEEQRLAVALVLIEGLPYKEAAQIIGVPMGTLTSRLARARQALQQLLGPGDGA